MLSILVLAVVLVGLELTLRWALFRSEQRGGFIGELRDAAHYADPLSDDLYWKLQYTWTPPDQRVSDAPVFDADVGWLGVAVTPGTYAHADAANLGTQRPLLLYGDSFANCVTPEDECFQALMADSALGDEYRLLNYGVGGYGLDQAFLLLRGSIDRYAERDPVVVFSLFVEGDIDRCVLDFRGWSKPRMRETEGGWTVVPPIQGSDAYFEQRPIRAGSYLLRYLAHGLLPRELLEQWPGGGARSEKQRIARHVFASLQAELDARGVPYFVLLFHSLYALRPGREPSWQEQFVRATLRELDIPFVSMRTEIERAVAGTGEPLDSFFIPRGERGVGHHNLSGNRLGVRAIERGLRGEFDGPSRAPSPGASD